jgi:hypothetical protein
MAAEQLHGAARLLADGPRPDAPTHLEAGDIVADRYRGPYRITRVQPLGDVRFLLVCRHVDQGVAGTAFEDVRGFAMLNRVRFEDGHWWDDETGALLTVVAGLRRPSTPEPRALPDLAPAAATTLTLPAAPVAQLSLFGGL